MLRCHPCFWPLSLDREAQHDLDDIHCGSARTKLVIDSFGTEPVSRVVRVPACSRVLRINLQAGRIMLAGKFEPPCPPLDFTQVKVCIFGIGRNSSNCLKCFSAKSDAHGVSGKSEHVVCLIGIGICCRFDPSDCVVVFSCRNRQRPRFSSGPKEVRDILTRSSKISAACVFRASIRSTERSS